MVNKLDLDETKVGFIKCDKNRWFSILKLFFEKSGGRGDIFYSRVNNV